jgi:ADP-ribose pyrophosphatase YjhB (NUDIX family)
MRFCSNCAAALVSKIPPGDNRERFCCENCGMIHYENPKVVVGTLPVWDDLVLLCKRAIEPRYGYWTLPAGFLENGETTAEGALRETSEEAGAHVELGQLFTAYDVVHVNQIHLFYQARLLDVEFTAGIESLDVRLFSEEDIPWSEIAFRTVSQTLERYFEDRRRGTFELHSGSIAYIPRFNTPQEKRPVET